ncbi:MAG: DUF2079 domain-containing protein [Pirellulaceae bacterium]
MSRLRKNPPEEEHGDTMVTTGADHPTQSQWANRMAWAAALCVALLWIVVVTGLSTRHHLVLLYNTLSFVPRWQEALAAPATLFLFPSLIAILWLLALSQASSVRGLAGSILAMAIAAAPSGLLAVASMMSLEVTTVGSYLELFWIACWTTLAFGVVSGRIAQRLEGAPKWIASGSIAAASIAQGCWFWHQSHQAAIDHRLGYNDFGHFAQRVVHTASGRGWLMESPTLPPFWDHFNPGLLLLVPLWKAWPSVDLFFAIQGFCLAAGGWLVYLAARAAGLSVWPSLLWGASWLLHPSVSQMNLAYTYGWHPVTLAIPLLLAAWWLVERRKAGWALAVALLAASMEETVVVAIAVWTAGQAIAGWWTASRSQQEDPGASRIRWQTWAGVSLSAVVGFLAIYRWSGMAEFQTARFAALGDTPWQIVLSPLLKPQAFWGQLLHWRSLCFVLALMLPWLPWGGWKSLSHWGPAMIPLGVLLVWDHVPAKSLGFQYPSTLLPMLVAAAVTASARPATSTRPWNAGLCGVTCAAVLSLFLGQLPWSSPTLTDVEARSYPSDSALRRASQPDGQWIANWQSRLRQANQPVLATGRLAAGLVGVPELETVGQYRERRKKLDQIASPRPTSLLLYQTLLLDLQESFQQSPQQTQELLQEALAAGFTLVEQKYQVAIMQRP